ncbi:hypothetical protein [Oleiagrimonas soli]|uniref:Right handed beta helix domain-containing protein n=1 Tax=Oleiagrimonas soli TaxID=1543381 RepID=A0A099CWY6_9GAMM|nr:hypothetical protein [Oleiagrimonas soli]KGI78264.1 hypothetical protein LF63_0108055 [Oleiagrimonas soli]MBB6183257.1 hypothetical protein [Oleiagrimonas soli]
MTTSDHSDDLVERIFAYDVLKDLDRAALLKARDASQPIEKLNAPLLVQRNGVVQQDSRITQIPKQGIVIDTPGSYTFAGDLTWTPEPSACAAITIVCSDVILDLGGFSLTANIEDNQHQIVGILIHGAEELSAVTVRNGVLADMCFYGIHAHGVEGLSIENVTIDGLSFANLDVRFMTPAGIHVNTARNLNIAHCTVQNLDVTADGSAGIQVLNTQGGNVRSCLLSQFVNHDGAVQGYSYLKSENIATTNCVSSHFQSHFNGNILTMGHTVLGFVPILCMNLIYENCSAANMTGCCDDCHGMSVFIDALVVVNNFTASGITDGVAASNSGAKATGLEVYGAAVSLNNCAVSNITAIRPQDKQGAGFSAWGYAIKFNGCVASQVIAVDEHGQTSHALGYGVGFGWAPDPRPVFRDVGAVKVEYTDCMASDCQVGFDTWFHIDSTWTRTRFANCEIGMLVEPGGKRTLSANPCSECNPPLKTVLTNIAHGNTYPGSGS